MRRAEPNCATTSDLLSRQRIIGRVKPLIEPGSGEGPVAVGCAEGNDKRQRGLLCGESGEVAQLDNLGDNRLLGGELIEDLVKCRQAAGRVVADCSDLVEINVAKPYTVAELALATGFFDQDASHRLDSSGEEMTARSNFWSPTKRSFALWTRVVVLRVCPGRLSAIFAAAGFRNSS
jgi:hypothetical protein